jgi:hypothetical protein
MCHILDAHLYDLYRIPNNTEQDHLKSSHIGFLYRLYYISSVWNKQNSHGIMLPDDRHFIDILFLIHHVLDYTSVLVNGEK